MSNFSFVAGWNLISSFNSDISFSDLFSPSNTSGSLGSGSVYEFDGGSYNDITTNGSISVGTAYFVNMNDKNIILNDLSNNPYQQHVFDVSLNSGWNMLSSPFWKKDIKFSDLNFYDSIDEIFSYNTSIQQFEYVDKSLGVMEYGRGYMINLNENVNSVIVNTSVSLFEQSGNNINLSLIDAGSFIQFESGQTDSIKLVSKALGYHGQGGLDVQSTYSSCKPCCQFNSWKDQNTVFINHAVQNATSLSALEVLGGVHIEGDSTLVSTAQPDHVLHVEGGNAIFRENLSIEKNLILSTSSDLSASNTDVRFKIPAVYTDSTGTLKSVDVFKINSTRVSCSMDFIGTPNSSNGGAGTSGILHGDHAFCIQLDGDNGRITCLRLSCDDGWVNHTTSGAQVITSDNRLKHNEVPITGGIDTILQLNPKLYVKTYSLYDESGNLYGPNHNFEDVSMRPRESFFESGFIAQEVRDISGLEHLVEGDELDASGNPARLSMHYDGLHAYTVKAIQELSAKVTALEARIVELEAGR